MSRGWQIASAVAMTIGLVCLFLSPFLDSGSLAFSIALALGVALLPTGIISIITALSSSRVIEEGVRTALERTTADLRHSIEGLEVTSDYLNASKKLGLVMVYPGREQALKPFMRHLDEYVLRRDHDSGKKHIIFVGSSLKGVIEDPNIAQQVERIIVNARDNCEFSFLLTHPRFSEYRGIQEDRSTWGIASEILHAITWLENRRIPSNSIRLYKGTPTNFLIASTEKMLINPYPYEKEAFKCFCLELENVQEESSIFASYWINHFHRPWQGGLSVTDHYIKPNSLGYFHAYFSGPLPKGADGTSLKLGAFADLFVVNDIGSFYLAVNINGLESEITYHSTENSSHEVLRIGRRFSVKLLDRTRVQPGWELVGNVELDDSRRGFWQSTIVDKKAFEAYSMIAVFDDTAESHLVFQGDPLLEGTPLPALWKELPRTEEMGQSRAVPLPFPGH